MKKQLFEMGAKLSDGWESDNRTKKEKSKVSQEVLPPEKHRLFLSREKRRGKWVSSVGPFAMPKAQLQSLLKRLKGTLGTGGTLREDRLEFQGDLGERLREALQKEGFRFR